MMSYFTTFLKKEKHENNPGAQDDFIDIYLQEIKANDTDPESSFHKHKGLQSLEVVLVDLFLGGSETTSTSLNWTILYLLHYPEVLILNF